MRTFSEGFQGYLDGDSFRPIVFCRYDLVTYEPGETPGTGTRTVTPYYWAERPMTYDGQQYESRLVKIPPLEQSLDSSNQVFGEMGLQISNFPTILAGAIQSGMKITVYYGLESGESDGNGGVLIEDAEEIFIGTVSGDIEITEDSISFSLIDIAHTYDRQIPPAITRRKFPLADPDSIGDVSPIIMGRVTNHECKPVQSGFASTLAEPLQAIKKAGYSKRYINTSEFYISDDAKWYLDFLIRRGSGSYYDSVTEDVDPTKVNFGDVNANQTVMAFIGNSITTAYSFKVVNLSFDSDKGLWKVTAAPHSVASKSAEAAKHGLDSGEKIYGYDEYGGLISTDETSVAFSDSEKYIPVADAKTFDVKVGVQVTFLDEYLSFTGGRFYQDNGSVPTFLGATAPFYTRPNHYNTYNIFWFLIADHPVADIRNVRINNIPVERLPADHFLNGGDDIEDPQDLLNNEFFYGAYDAATTDQRITDEEFFKRKTFYKLFNGDFSSYSLFNRYGPEIAIDSAHPENNPSLIAIYQPSNKTFLSQIRSGADDSKLEGDISVEDSLGVIDTIGVVEPGHIHQLGEFGLFNHEIDLSWTKNGAGDIAFNIEIISGTFKLTVFNYILGRFSFGLDTATVSIPSPYRFTSNSSTFQIRLRVFATGTSGVILNDINYSATVESVATGASVSTMGSADPIAEGNVASPFKIYPSYRTIYPKFTGSDRLEDGGAAEAEVEKTGNVALDGNIALAGQLTLNSNSASDSFLGGNVTCDVVAVCDGSMTPATGIVRYAPHQMIRKLIDKYAINQVDPIEYGDETSGIVIYDDEDSLTDYFDKIYNSFSSSTISEVYKALNFGYSGPESNEGEIYESFAVGDLNPSPSVGLDEYAQKIGMHNLDFAITEPNRLRDIIGEMLYHSNCILNWRNGIAVIKLHPDNPAEDKVIDRSGILMKSMSLSKKDITNLGTQISVRFDYNPFNAFEREFEYAKISGFGANYSKTDLDAARVYGNFSQERMQDLPMIRDQNAAEIIAKRMYDRGLGGKFITRFDTIISALDLDPGDFLSVQMPAFQNAFLNRGVITRKVLSFGSAIDRSPDIITFEVDQNYTPDPTYVVLDDLQDSLAIVDSDPVLILNYDGQLFLDLDDAITILDELKIVPITVLTDSLSITENLAFDRQLILTDSVDITEVLIRGSVLFGQLFLDDTMTLSESITINRLTPDSVYELGVFVDTDLTDLDPVGVFE